MAFKVNPINFYNYFITTGTSARKLLDENSENDEYPYDVQTKQPTSKSLEKITQPSSSSEDDKLSSSSREPVFKIPAKKRRRRRYPRLNPTFS